MAATQNVIHTPAGRLIEIQKDGVTVRARIEWDGSFAARANSGWTRAQRKFSMEVARKMDPYVPFDTGVLKSSVISASDFDRGQLVYSTPYARPQYYRCAQGKGLKGRRGPWWGQRCVADNKDHFAQFGRACIGEVFKR